MFWERVEWFVSDAEKRGNKVAVVYDDSVFGHPRYIMTDGKQFYQFDGMFGDLYDFDVCEDPETHYRIIDQYESVMESAFRNGSKFKLVRRTDRRITHRKYGSVNYMQVYNKDGVITNFVNQRDLYRMMMSYNTNCFYVDNDDASSPFVVVQAPEYGRKPDIENGNVGFILPDDLSEAKKQRYKKKKAVRNLGAEQKRK